MDVNTTTRSGWLGKVGLASALLVGGSGCMPLPTFLHKPEASTGPDRDSFILRPDGLVEDKTGPKVSDVGSGDLSTGREFFRTGDYAKAETAFCRIVENDKTAPNVAQEAMYYQAESMRMQKKYPDAADHYVALLGKFPTSSYREQCVQQMFTIANYWLDETRVEMKEEKEKREGKRWVVWPRFVSFEKSMPLLDREGRAILLLEQVRLHDINGPMADQALFWCGVVKMYNEDFRDADYYLSQIHARHPESPLASQSLELAIYCKRMSTGGADYDGRKVAEARKLIQTAMRNYPQIASDPVKRAFLEKEMLGINSQQAEKDFERAGFYRRTGHPASAYFQYELVRRRYPNTKFARMAEEQWNELRAELEKSGKGIPPSPPGPAQPGKPAMPSMDRPIPSTNNQWDRGTTQTLPPPTSVPQIVSPTLPPATAVPTPNLVPAPPVPK